MRSLMRQRCDILRLTVEDVDGVGDYTWVKIATGVRCQVDLSFMRKGKDAGWVAEAGRPVDRRGVLFVGKDVDLKPGDRVVVRSRAGLVGTFALDGAFDTVDDRYGAVHHIEAGVTEVATALAGGPDT